MAESEKPATQTVIGILLNVTKEEADVQLLVSYLVSSASWKPRYDLRVSSQARTMEVRGEGTGGVVSSYPICIIIQVGYFGVVQQSTGEDW